jgi:hypothetical protein
MVRHTLKSEHCATKISSGMLIAIGGQLPLHCNEFLKVVYTIYFSFAFIFNHKKHWLTIW